MLSAIRLSNIRSFLGSLEDVSYLKVSRGDYSIIELTLTESERLVFHVQGKSRNGKISWLPISLRPTCSFQDIKRNVYEVLRQDQDISRNK